MNENKNFDRNNRKIENKKQNLDVNVSLEFANENDAQFLNDKNLDKNNKNIKFDNK